MEEFLSHRGILFKDLKGFVLQQAERLKVHAHAVAEKAGRPYEYFEWPVRKDQRARAIAARDGITEGVVCVFGTIEPCRSFRLAYGPGRPTIRPAWRKCLFLSFYFLDREFGFCHARVQTWFPFTMLSTSTATSGSPARWTSAGCGTGDSRMPSSGWSCLLYTSDAADE